MTTVGSRTRLRGHHSANTGAPDAPSTHVSLAARVRTRPPPPHRTIISRWRCSATRAPLVYHPSHFNVDPSAVCLNRALAVRFQHPRLRVRKSVQIGFGCIGGLLPLIRLGGGIAEPARCSRGVPVSRHAARARVPPTYPVHPPHRLRRQMLEPARTQAISVNPPSTRSRVLRDSMQSRRQVRRPQPAESEALPLVVGSSPRTALRPLSAVR